MHERVHAQRTSSCAPRDVSCAPASDLERTLKWPQVMNSFLQLCSTTAGHTTKTWRRFASSSFFAALPLRPTSSYTSVQACAQGDQRRMEAGRFGTHASTMSRRINPGAHEKQQHTSEILDVALLPEHGGHGGDDLRRGSQRTKSEYSHGFSTSGPLATWRCSRPPLVGRKRKHSTWREDDTCIPGSSCRDPSRLPRSEKGDRSVLMSEL